MDLITALLLFGVAALLYILQRRPKHFPPGPRNWPLIGSIPAMAALPKDTPFDQLEALRKQFGNVVGLFLGVQPAILVSGYEEVKEVCGREDLTFRPNITIPFHKMFDFKRMGVIFTDGDMWKNQRRFTLRHLRDFGFGKQAMDHYVHEEVSVLFAAINDLSETKGVENRGGGIDVLSILPAVAINTLWYIIAGHRHDLQDQKFQQLTKMVLRIIRLGDQTSPVLFYKFLQNLPVISRNFQEQVTCGDELNLYIKKALNEHLQTFDENHIRDFMDVYIREMQQDKTGFFTGDQLVAICLDLFLAGTETTASTTGFTLRYLIKHPEVQDKVREEIFRVVGKNRLPSTNDIPNLHFCSAVLAESQRHAGVFPFAPPRSAEKDATLKGYHIPKRALIMLNLWSVNMDKKHWGDPENFRPERFIDADGKFHKDDHLVVFGTGQRLCLGEPFARNTIFQFYTSLVQNYKMEIPPHGLPPSDVTLPGFTTAPGPFKITFTKL